MFEDPKKNQNQSDQGIQDEGSAGGVASQDYGQTGDLGDTGTGTSSDIDQNETDDDMTQ